VQGLGALRHLGQKAQYRPSRPTPLIKAPVCPQLPCSHPTKAFPVPPNTWALFHVSMHSFVFRYIQNALSHLAKILCSLQGISQTLPFLEHPPPTGCSCLSNGSVPWYHCFLTASPVSVPWESWLSSESSELLKGQVSGLRPRKSNPTGLQGLKQAGKTLQDKARACLVFRNGHQKTYKSLLNEINI
jgi:hypothetical protein